MAISVPTTVIGTVDVTRHIENYIKATTALKTAKTAEEIAKLKNLRMASIFGVADALTSVLPLDPQAAQAASVAFNTIELTRTTMVLPSTLNIGAIAGLIFGVVSLFFGLVSLFSRRKKSITIRLGWSGEVVIKVKRVNNKIQLTYEVRPSSVMLLDKLTDQIKKFVDNSIKQANEYLAEAVPERDVDFVWRYLPRPANDTIVVRLSAIRSASVSSQGDVDRLVQDVVKEINKQLGDILRAIRDLTEGACILTFLNEIGASDRIDYAVEGMLPGLGYQVEGLWRKELEKLSIKLTRTREYDRQIAAGIRASVVQLIADAIAKTPTTTCGGKGLSCDKAAIRQKLYNMARQNVEIRYGMDLIGENYPFNYKFKQIGPKSAKYILPTSYNVPPGWLYQVGRYVLKPEVIDGKLMITYDRLNVEVPKVTFKCPYDFSSGGRDIKEYVTTSKPRHFCFDKDVSEQTHKVHFVYRYPVHSAKIIKSYPCGGLYETRPPSDVPIEEYIVIKVYHTPEPNNDFYDYILMRILNFINYLLSEIRPDAAKYIKDKITTVEVFVNHYKMLNDAKAKITADLYGRRKQLMRISLGPGLLTPFRKHFPLVFEDVPFYMLWLLSTINGGYQWDSYRWKGMVLDYYNTFRLLILKDILSINVPNYDQETYTNLPRALNAMVHDIVDVYYIWLNGYGEEWKKRIRTQILEQSLPNLRIQLKSTIYQIASTYAYLPQPAIDVGELEITATVLNEVDKRIEEITDYLPIIVKNKDTIVRMFGIEEYNNLLKDVESYRAQLYQKRAEYIKERLQKVDLEFLDSLDINKLSDIELEALNTCLDNLIANLKKQIDRLDVQIIKYKAIINELKQL